MKLIARTPEESIRYFADKALDEISAAMSYAIKARDEAATEYQRRKTNQLIQTLNRASLTLHGLLCYKPRGPQRNPARGKPLS